MEEEIIQPIDRALLKRELTLERQLRMTNKSNNEIYVITAQNAPTVNPYIQSVRFNKKDVTSTWIPWHQLENGGVLDFVMGNMPDRHWGTGSNAAPPSFY